MAVGTGTDSDSQRGCSITQEPGSQGRDAEAWNQRQGCRDRGTISTGSPAPARQLIKMQSGHPGPVPTVSRL